MNIRLLVVDDESMIAILVRRTLETGISGLECDWVIHEAANGLQGLALHEQAPYDVILLDLNMPGLGGLDVIRRLAPKTTGVKVIIMSAQQDFRQAQEIISLGAFDYLLKPFGVNDLHRTLEAAVRRIEAARRERVQLDNLKAELAESSNRVRLLATITDNERHRFGIILDSIEEALLACDLSGIVALANKKALELFGLKPDECIGSAVEHVVQDPEFRAALEKRKNPGASDPGTVLFNGRHYLLEILSIFHPSRNGEVVGTLVLFHDRTEETNAFMVRNSFLSIVAHELRTPLTSLSSDLFLLQSGHGERDSIFFNMREAFTSLTSSVNNLIKVALYSDPDAPVHPAILNLRELIQSITDGLHPRALERNIAIRTDFRLPTPSITSDPDKLAVALSHLLGNAVKFSRPGGSVRFLAEERGEWIALCVSDEGEGIPPEHLPDLFKGFVQADQALSRRHNGMGVGLFLVKKAAELLSGRVEVESEPGRGSRFTLFLPAASSFAAVDPTHPLQEVPHGS